MYDTPRSRAFSAEARCHLAFLYIHRHFPCTTETIAIQFKCKATQKKRHLCLPFTVRLPQQSPSLGQYNKGPPPLVLCFTDQPDHSVASDWLLDTLDLYLIRMDHPFCSCPLFWVPLPIFLHAIFCD